MDELFRLSGFSFTYPQQRRPALTGIDLTVHPGEFWVLCGPSGCGKSTLLSVVSGLEPLTAGTVEVDGAPVRGSPPGRSGSCPSGISCFPGALSGTT